MCLSEGIFIKQECVHLWLCKWFAFHKYHVDDLYCKYNRGNLEKGRTYTIVRMCIHVYNREI